MNFFLFDCCFSGVFPNPSDCCSFYNCDDCRAFLQKCGKGTQFSPKLKVCDYAETAGCKARNNCESFY